MLDLSGPHSGSIGPGCWFSNLFVAALEARFTGGLLLRTSTGDRALFFQNGDPVHAGGAGFSSHYLGQLIAEMGLAPSPSVMEVLQHHQSIPEAERPLVGEVFATRLNLPREDIEVALRAQCENRFAQCFELGSAEYYAAPGESESIRLKAVPIEGWPILLKGLTEFGSDGELREASERLLGRAVKMKGSLRQLEALMNLPREVRAGLRYLDKPRKPDQLERALKRRPARGLLRMLELLDLLEVQPVAKAIPIPKATLRKNQLNGSLGNGAPAADAAKSTTVTVPPPSRTVKTPPPKSEPPARKPSSYTDVEKMFGELGQLNHYSILGVEPEDPPSIVRRRYTELVKKYHPDAYSGSGAPTTITEKVREISTRINEAYRVLANVEARAEYEQLLADGRIKGDVRKKDLVREAELKAKMALVHLKKREFDKARALFRYATENDPNTIAYKAHLAWTMLADPNFDRDEALREGLPVLQQAVKADPSNANAQFYLGRAYREQGKLDKALEHFKAAAKLDKHFVDAEREARLASRRLGNTKTTGKTDVRGVLSRFFKTP